MEEIFNECTCSSYKVKINHLYRFNDDFKRVIKVFCLYSEVVDKFLSDTQRLLSFFLLDCNLHPRSLALESVTPTYSSKLAINVIQFECCVSTPKIKIFKINKYRRKYLILWVQKYNKKSQKVLCTMSTLHVFSFIGCSELKVRQSKMSWACVKCKSHLWNHIKIMY